MTWVVAGGIVCAVLVVLAGLLIGRAMRAADRAQTAAGHPVAGSPEGHASCVCDVDSCALRRSSPPHPDAAAPIPHGSDADER